MTTSDSNYIWFVAFECLRIFASKARRDIDWPWHWSCAREAYELDWKLIHPEWSGNHLTDKKRRTANNCWKWHKHFFSDSLFGMFVVNVWGRRSESSIWLWRFISDARMFEVSKTFYRETFTGSKICSGFIFPAKKMIIHERSYHSEVFIYFERNYYKILFFICIFICRRPSSYYLFSGVRFDERRIEVI